MSGHLSHGTVESWSECGALLQHHLLVLPQNVVYSMLCFSGGFFVCFFPVGDGMKGQAQFQTDTVQIPGTYLCDLW